MEYYIRELLSETKEKEREKHAGGKARKDVNELFEREGMKHIDFYANDEAREKGKLFQKMIYHLFSLRCWTKKTKRLKKGDTLYVQFPTADHFIFQGLFFGWLRMRKIHIVLLIHDLMLLREALRKDKSIKERIRLWLEEKITLKQCSYMIVHNDRMERYLRNMHIGRNKIVNLRIFDYLIPGWDEEKASKRQISRSMPVIIAGNLSPSKAGYVYQLPEGCRFHLYGVLYEGEDHGSRTYMGAFLPEELPYVMDGSFGLVWDGESAKTCSGIYGKYLQINNPHKTSLYLASGIPVIIWEKAALADFVKKYKVGIPIKSLEDLEHTLEAITEDEYDEMLIHAKKMAVKLRSGYFTKRAVSICRRKIRS